MIVDRHLLPTISSAPPIGRFLESICALLSVLRSWTTFPGAGEGCHRRSEAAAEPAAAPSSAQAPSADTETKGRRPAVRPAILVAQCLWDHIVPKLAAGRWTFALLMHSASPGQFSKYA